MSCYARVPAAIALLGFLSAAGCRAPEQPRNLLLVTLDTTRADRLGCYGYARETSPNLDALAAEGVLFTHAVAQASVTNTSHASLFTGLDPYHHGVRLLLDRRLSVLGDEHTTLAEVLMTRGWHTGAMVSAPPASSAFGLDQGFDHFDEELDMAGVGQRRGDETADRAIGWLESTPEPFFLWTHFFDPHDPKLLPPIEICNLFKPERTDNLLVNRQALYDAEIYFMDLQVGRLLEALDRLRLSDRTVVVVVGDHGEAFGEHDWFGHGPLYQEQVRIPLIVRLPGGPAGLRIDEMVRSIDVPPSLFGCLAIPRRHRPRVDGVDLAPLLADPTRPLVPFAYSEAVNMQTYRFFGRKWYKTDKHYALTDGRWKLIYHQLRPAESELYDLVEDPQETSNLFGAGLPAERQLLRELRRLDPMVDEISGFEQPAPELLRALRALGYTE